MPNVEVATVENIARQAALKPSYLILMGASGVLAAVAFLSDSVPLLVGSMVVSPIFAPLALTSFALVCKRLNYAAAGAVAAVAGLAVSAACAMATTWVLNVTHVFPEEANLIGKALLEERVNVGWYSAVAAFAAGIAGAIAIAKGKMDTLVGVVAALALVPAAAAAGIALISGDSSGAWGGLLLLTVNVSVTVVTGIATLLVVKPDQEED